MKGINNQQYKQLQLKAITMLSAVLLLSACGAKKQLVKDNSKVVAVNNTTTAPQVAKKENSEALLKLAFIQKVADTKVFNDNITGSMSFSLNAGNKSINLPGSIKMRKNKVIRLQLFIPLLGTEVGRLEFTPEYVLVVDRLHKEYIKGDYSQIDFLKTNGLNFYSLQSLFWNQLLLPGQNNVTESDLKKYDVKLATDNASQNIITFSKDKFKYEWKADKTDGRISDVAVQYNSADHGTSLLTWKYNNFKSVGVKSFPAEQEFQLSTNAMQKQKQATIKISMNEVKTDSDWEERTTLSDRYKKIEAQDVLGKIMSAGF
ncbi:MAG: DUF4292 domain-containing protein [Prevotella sp.]